MNARISTRAVLSGTDLQAEGLIAWQSFEEFSSGLAGFEEIRQNGYWYALEGAAEGRNLYTYFPFLFSDLFPELSREQLRKVSMMTLLYLYNVLLADAVMDDERASAPPLVLVSNAYLLKALEVIEDLLGSRPFPWNQIQELHHEYSVAVLREWEDHVNKLERYQSEDIFKILSAKASMAKLIVVVLCALTDRLEYLNPLTRSFEFYYAADQLFDDYRDWKKDLKKGQYSYLLTQIIISCGLEERIQGLGPAERIEVVGKHFYLSGIAETYFDSVCSYWNEAKLSLGSLKCPLWVGFINGCQLRASGVRSAIAAKGRAVLLQPQRYLYALSDPVNESLDQSCTVHPVSAVSETISQCGHRAADFLLSRHRPNLGFEDFVVFGQTLPVWVGAYVGIALSRWLDNPHCQSATKSDLRSVLDQLAGDLVRLRGDIGWATNGGRAPDADTTAWVITFLREIGAACSCNPNDLLAYRRHDGGFCTYLASGLGDGFESYSQSHVEVTAIVLETLLRNGFDGDDSRIQQAVEFIQRKQEATGYWESYWWDGSMYGTYHCLRALFTAGRFLSTPTRDYLLGRIVADQALDGSWGQQTIGKNIAFETALALKTLLLLDGDSRASAAIFKGMVWLLNNQNGEGSWASGPMMRVPVGQDETPWRTSEWVLDSPNNCGVIVRDQNRFFTTATALSAITDFLLRIGDLRLTVQYQRETRAVA